MAVLCEATTKSAGIGLSITTVCKNTGKKTLGQGDFFVVLTTYKFIFFIICFVLCLKVDT